MGKTDLTPLFLDFPIFICSVGGVFFCYPCCCLINWCYFWLAAVICITPCLFPENWNILSLNWLDIRAGSVLLISLPPLQGGDKNVWETLCYSKLKLALSTTSFTADVDLLWHLTMEINFKLSNILSELWWIPLIAEQQKGYQ